MFLGILAPFFTTEYKISFYYDIRNNIVTFRKTWHFGESQFNKAFAYIIKESIARESGEDCSFFNVVVEPITSMLDIPRIHEILIDINYIKKFTVKFNSQNEELYLTEATRDSGLTNKEIRAETTSELGLNLNSDYVVSICDKIVDFHNRLEETPGGSLEISIENTVGDKYSNTARGKYTKRIIDTDNSEEFRNICRDNIDFVLQNREQFELV